MFTPLAGFTLFATQVSNAIPFIYASSCKVVHVPVPHLV